MSPLKQAALDLVEELERKGQEARAGREKHKAAEVTALQHDDEPSAIEHEALAAVWRGCALAYEDAAHRVKIFVDGIPEGP